MKLDIQTSGHTAIITVLQSRMDAAVAPAFRGKITELVSSRHRELIVDMGQVSFIDSSVLGAMVSSYKLVISNGGSLSLCDVNGAVFELLELTRLNNIFPCYESVGHAQSFLRAA